MQSSLSQSSKGMHWWIDVNSLSQEKREFLISYEFRFITSINLFYVENACQ